MSNGEKPDLQEHQLEEGNGVIPARPNDAHDAEGHDLDLDVSTFIPQPSDDPEDPLNWPLWLKICILAQICILAAVGTLNAAIINPAYVPMAKELGISTVTASYQTTVVIAINGIGPFIWVPLANIYGRRPIYLGTSIIGFASILGSAYAKTYGQLVGARVINGFFPAAMALGPASVVDIFFMHQRGRALGLFAVFFTTGAHIAPILGGLVGQYLGWRWCFKLCSCLDAFLIVMVFFCYPETLYVRDPNRLAHHRTAGGVPKLTKKLFIKRLRLYSTYPQLKLRLRQFVIPVFKMAKYPSVLFPALYYCTQYGFSSNLPATTVAAIFSARFGWDTLQIGLGYGGALSIGGILGEFLAGMVVDAIVVRERKRLGRPDPPPEVRLKAIWTGAIICPIGLLIYGFTIEYHSPWIAPLIGMATAVFGQQIIATTCYTYAIDCYRAEGGEIALLINFIRQEIGMTFAFYVVKLCNRIGFQYAFLMFALVGSVLAALPIVVLMYRGERIREYMGVPHNVNVFDDDEMVAGHEADAQDPPNKEIAESK
ncbi:Major facilitator superfamily domain, general substrate transporter [Niveomyces insectorum RCEF 264]|uniref:Major facilitator superfamily domain, general substrate transporter n=1 Tax=Niveomyces insectorum RCEF 264 TaxID=1081102 RepID=A0A167XRY1_9HYPO|nr:Major facilitator superfamily domain, general substrate transporter [Niveomyces insectorum RCEF 264]